MQNERHLLLGFSIFAGVLILGLNMIQADTIVGGNIGSATWNLAGSPYIVTSTVNVGAQGGAPGATLIIEAGVVVKFNAGTGIVLGYYNTGNQKIYYGSLRVLGSANSPVTFIANTVAPAPSFWSGITFSNYSYQSPSEISFATISHATTAVSTSYISAPLIHHVRFESNNRGISYSPNTNTTSLPTMYQNSFVGNVASTNNAIQNNSPTIKTIGSTLCWWNSTSGPSGAGPGSGQSISAGVEYEPWLTSVVSNLHYFSSVAIMNRTFNPSIGAYATISFQTNQIGNWIVNILSGATVIRTFSGSGASSSAVWDGKNQSGVLQPNGTYAYEVQSTSLGGDSAAPAHGITIIDTNKQLTISSFTASSIYFNLNTTFTGTINFDDPSWTIQIRDSLNNVVRTATGVGAPVSFVWDGKNDSGVLQADGVYTAQLTAVEGTATATASTGVTHDRTPPVAIMHSPTNSVLSNVYQNGSTDVPFIVTAQDVNFHYYTLDRYTLPSGPTTNHVTTYQQASNQLIYTYATVAVTNGSSSTFTLRARDLANNQSTVAITVSVGNLNVSMNAQQLNSSTGGTVTHTSIVPFALTETIVIKNLADQVVRTLVSNASRAAAGNYASIWDGRNDLGQLLPDGPYFIVSTVTAGSTTFIFDPRDRFSGFLQVYPSMPTGYDPWKNQPLTFSYVLSAPKQVTFALGITQPMPSTCDPPNLCVLYRKYKQSGSHTLSWASVDTAGVFYNSFSRYALVTEPVPPNVVVLFGTDLVLSNLSVTPGIYGPFQGFQTISFTLSTFQSQPSNSIQIAFLNQSSLSVLRTITLSGTPPGPVNVQWDGRADNGMFVAPGRYTVTITIIDSLGNSYTTKTLTNIKY